MKENSASERHQNNNLKAVLAFSNYFGQTCFFFETASKYSLVKVFQYIFVLHPYIQSL